MYAGTHGVKSHDYDTMLSSLDYIHFAQGWYFAEPTVWVADLTYLSCRLLSLPSTSGGVRAQKFGALEMSVWT